MSFSFYILSIAALAVAFSLKGTTNQYLFQSRILRTGESWFLRPLKSLDLLLKAASQDLPAVADIAKESDDSKQVEELIADTTKFKARAALLERVVVDMKAKLEEKDTESVSLESRIKELSSQLTEAEEVAEQLRGQMESLQSNFATADRVRKSAMEKKLAQVREEGFQLQLKLTQEIEELRKQTESVAAEAERYKARTKLLENALFKLRGQYEDLRTQYGTATSQRDELQARVEKQLETISNLEQQLTEQAKIVRAQERKQARIEAQYEVQLETARKQIAKLKRSNSQSADTDTDSASTNDASMKEKEKNGVVLRNKKMERSGKASDGRWAEQQQKQQQTDDPLQSMWEGFLKATIGIPRPTAGGAQASNNENEFEEEDMGLEGEEENAAAVAATATASEDADREPSQPQSQTSAEETQQRMSAELEALVKEKQQVESELRREVREAKDLMDLMESEYLSEVRRLESLIETMTKNRDAAQGDQESQLETARKETLAMKVQLEEKEQQRLELQSKLDDARSEIAELSAALRILREQEKVGSSSVAPAASQTVAGAGVETEDAFMKQVAALVTSAAEQRAASIDASLSADLRDQRKALEKQAQALESLVSQLVNFVEKTATAEKKGPNEIAGAGRESIGTKGSARVSADANTDSIDSSDRVAARSDAADKEVANAGRLDQRMKSDLDDDEDEEEDAGDFQFNPPDLGEVVAAIGQTRRKVFSSIPGLSGRRDRRRSRDKVIDDSGDWLDDEEEEIDSDTDSRRRRGADDDEDVAAPQRQRSGRLHGDDRNRQDQEQQDRFARKQSQLRIARRLGKLTRKVGDVVKFWVGLGFMEDEYDGDDGKETGRGQRNASSSQAGQGSARNPAAVRSKLQSTITTTAEIVVPQALPAVISYGSSRSDSTDDSDKKGVPVGDDGEDIDRLKSSR